MLNTSGNKSIELICEYCSLSPKKCKCSDELTKYHFVDKKQFTRFGKLETKEKERQS